jgi:arylsulfatase A-like enzyme
MVTAFIAAPIHACEVFAQPDESPNIILIYLDDMGYGDLEITGAYGYQTPNINKMVSKGMFFSHFYAPQAVCSPSRAGLMTGSYPSRVGFGTNVGPSSNRGLSTDEMTIAGLLKQKGYNTAIYGKWHLGHQDVFLPFNHGFDEYYGIPYSNDMWPLHPERPDAYPDLPLIENNKVVNPAVTPEDQEQFTTIFTEKTVEFIQRNRTRPFLFTWHIQCLTFPYMCPTNLKVNQRQDCMATS